MITIVEKNGTFYQYEYNRNGALIGWRHKGNEEGCFWAEWEYFGDENTTPSDVQDEDIESP